MVLIDWLIDSFYLELIILTPIGVDVTIIPLMCTSIWHEKKLNKFKWNQNESDHD